MSPTSIEKLNTLATITTPINQQTKINLSNRLIAALTWLSVRWRMITIFTLALITFALLIAVVFGYTNGIRPTWTNNTPGIQLASLNSVTDIAGTKINDIKANLQTTTDQKIKLDNELGITKNDLKAEQDKLVQTTANLDVKTKEAEKLTTDLANTQKSKEEIEKQKSQAEEQKAAAERTAGQLSNTNSNLLGKVNSTSKQLEDTEQKNKGLSQAVVLQTVRSCLNSQGYVNQTYACTTGSSRVDCENFGIPSSFVARCTMTNGGGSVRVDCEAQNNTQNLKSSSCSLVG